MINDRLFSPGIISTNVLFSSITSDVIDPFLVKVHIIVGSRVEQAEHWNSTKLPFTAVWSRGLVINTKTSEPCPVTIEMIWVYTLDLCISIDTRTFHKTFVPLIRSYTVAKTRFNKREIQGHCISYVIICHAHIIITPCWTNDKGTKRYWCHIRGELMSDNHLGSVS